VDASFLKLQADKTFWIRQHVLGLESPEKVKAELLSCGQAELDFYQGHHRLPAYRVANGV
jgi:hypothetical protein